MGSFFFFGRRNKKTEDDEGSNNRRSNAADLQVNSNSDCAICHGRASAKLLIITGEWNFLYCYRCRGWYQTHYATGRSFRVQTQKIETALTWLWNSEFEMIEENRRAMEQVHKFLRTLGFDRQGSREEEEADPMA